jgi:hypothetical protein
LIEDASQGGASLAMDNANATREERTELARLGHGHGAMVTAYYFESRL